MESSKENEYNQVSGWGDNPPHMCHCIGCCRQCGHCRTDPKHTEDACRGIQRANRIKARALLGIEESK